MTILIVDDEIIQVNGMSKMVAKMCENAQVITAFDGKEALDILASNKVDVVFADIKMPNIDGLEMLKLWRSRGHASETKPYFIFISGYDEFKYAQTAIRYGAIDYLLKPLDINSLSRVIGRVIDTVGKSNVTSEDEISDVIIKQIREYFLEHMDEKLSLEEIAYKFSYHPNYLSTMWSRKTNVPLMSYLQNIRMQKACDLLTETEFKIGDIARMVGYSDDKYFSRVFKSAFNISPNSFRRQKRMEYL